jgi:signal transduction histidine kinase
VGSSNSRWTNCRRCAANPGQLEQVFVNLLLNAAQALDPGRGDGRVELRARREGDRVVVLVHDDGPGIAPEHLARVFDPFFTTKPVGLGTGLGLSICHMILQPIGGEIGIESHVGRGTTVRSACRWRSQSSRRQRRPRPAPPGRSASGSW